MTSWSSFWQSVPTVEFEDLDKADENLLSQIRRKGCVVIKNVVDDTEATKWKDDLREYVQANPVNGQFLILYPLYENIDDPSL